MGDVESTFELYHHYNKAGWKLLLGDSEYTIRMVLRLTRLLYDWVGFVDKWELRIRRKWFFSPVHEIEWGSKKYTVVEHSRHRNSIFSDGIQIGYTTVTNNTIVLVCNDDQPRALMLLIAGTTNCDIGGADEVNIGRFIWREHTAFDHSWIPTLAGDS